MKKACLLLLVVLFTVCNLSYTFAEEKIDPPVLIKKVKLIYPKYALKNKIEGRAILKVLVSEKGTVDQIDIIQSTGDTSLDQAAIDAVKQWEFYPALIDGEKSASLISLPVVFKLK